MWQEVTSLLNWKKHGRYSGLTQFVRNSSRFSQERLRSEGYYSQYGQDKLVAETLLPGVRDGVFVDIGAHDGVAFSNTFYFEQKLGWTGVAIEPIPEIFERLKNNRQCITVNGCVGSKSGKARFQSISGYSEMLSGLVDEYDPRHLKRVEQEQRTRGGSIKEIDVDCYILNDLLEKYQIKHVDYLSIDVEGAECSILDTLDLNRCSVAVIGVENNYKDNRVSQLLAQKGFKLHSSIRCDEFYVKA